MKFTIIGKEDEKSLNFISYIKENLQLEEDGNSPDIVISVGGDGTFIRAVHAYPNAIHFGVHTGHLGFYANYTHNDLKDLIQDINENLYHVDYLDTLAIVAKEKNKSIQAFALNEMTIITPPRTLILDVFVDKTKLEAFRGTGFCISTAYGSTAYNKSLHGAVIDPLVKGFQLTEIAGINSNQYRTLSSPLLLSEKRSICLKSENPIDVWLTIDNLSYNLHDLMEIKVRLNQNQIKVGYHNQSHFVERIRRTFLK